MLVNLAASHTDVVSESKKKAEAVLAAPTKKQAGSLARVEGGGGISCFPDNRLMTNILDIFKHGSNNLIFKCAGGRHQAHFGGQARDLEHPHWWREDTSATCSKYFCKG